MTTAFLLLGTLIAGVPNIQADTLPVAVAPLEQLLPAEVVASRVRGVLRDHTNADAWQGLAGALPEMIVRGGADIESIFEAARLADEMSGTSLEASPPVTSTSPGRTFAWPEWLDIRRVAVLWENGIAYVLWMAIALLGAIIGPRTLRRRETKPVPVAPVRSRLRDARALAGKGRSIAEISRETRLAREALSVLLQPHGG